jgi:hypothetical protein
MRNIHFSPKEGEGAGRGEKDRPRAPLDQPPSHRLADSAPAKVVLEAFLSKGATGLPRSVSTPCSKVVISENDHIVISELVGDCERIVLMVSGGKIRGPDGRENDDLETCSMDAPIGWEREYGLVLIKEGEKITGFRLEKIVLPAVEDETATSSEKGRLMVTPDGVTMVMLNIPKAELAGAGRTFEIKLGIRDGKVTSWEIEPKD